MNYLSLENKLQFPYLWSKIRSFKRINYLIFQKIGPDLFANLYLRINQQGKIPIMKLPLLAYISYNNNKATKDETIFILTC